MESISIIICTHNREDLVADLVLSFKEQKDYTKEKIELIVVASACNDDTVQRISKLADSSFPVQIIDEPLPGLSLARNRGLERAKNEIIAFLDDDIRLVGDWLVGIVSAFDTNHDIVGGKILLWWNNTIEPSWLHFYHKRLLGYNDHGDDVKPISSGNIFGGNFAIRRKVYQEIGGFSSKFGRKGAERLAGEEADYFLRATNAGFKFLYTPRATVEHLVDQNRSTIEYLTNSAFGVGQTRILLPDRISNIGIQLIFEKLSLLFAEAEKELQSRGLDIEYMFHKTRRFDLLGELIGTLKYTFGNINDVSESDITARTLSDSATAASGLAKTTINNGILLSIIIPAFNAARLIGSAISSIINQTVNLNVLEIIVIDDASTDNNADVVNGYRRRFPNFKLVRQTKNKKQGAARNAGLNLARGQYITFLDADDYLPKDSFATLLRNGDGIDVVIGQHCFMEGEKVIRKSARRVGENSCVSSISGEVGWWPFGLLISRNVIEKNKIRFREGVFFEDIDFVIKTLSAANTVKMINDIVYNYVVHPDSTVNQLNEKKLSDSAEAVTATRYFVSLTEKGSHHWRKASAKWILGQFKRIREQNNNDESKFRLSDTLFYELEKRNLIEYFDEDFSSELLLSISSSLMPHGSAPITYFRAANHLLRAKAFHLARHFYQKADEHHRGEMDILIKPNIDICDKNSAASFVSLQKPRLETRGLPEIDYLFIPHNHYHAKSFIRIADRLKSSGISCRILDTTTIHPNEGQYIEASSSLYISIYVLLAEAFIPRAIVTMNDWEPHIAGKLVEWANSRGLATYGIVEGVNDFYDVDTKLNRRAYQKVRNLFLNGDFDRKYFSDAKQRLEVVGIERLGEVFAKSSANKTKRQASKALVNCNFTYGVLSDKAQEWIKDVGLASKAHGLSVIITKHHADLTDTGEFSVTSRPLYDELLESGIFITRFSGAVFEAIVAGCAVIYYNPNIEKIDKFIDPLGAYLYADCFDELSAAIKKIVSGWTPTIDKFLDLHAGSVYSQSSDSDFSLRKIESLLLNDALENKNKVKKDLRGGHVYFDARFNKWRLGIYEKLISHKQ